MSALNIDQPCFRACQQLILFYSPVVRDLSGYPVPAVSLWPTRLIQLLPPLSAVIPDLCQRFNTLFAFIDLFWLLLLLSSVSLFQIIQYPFEIPLKRCFLFFGKTFEKDGIHIIGDPAVACLH